MSQQQTPFSISVASLINYYRSVDLLYSLRILHHKSSRHLLDASHCFFFVLSSRFSRSLTNAGMIELVSIIYAPFKGPGSEPPICFLWRLAISRRLSSLYYPDWTPLIMTVISSSESHDHRMLAPGELSVLAISLLKFWTVSKVESFREEIRCRKCRNHK